MRELAGWPLFERVVLLCVAAIAIAFATFASVAFTFVVLLAGSGDRLGDVLDFFTYTWPFVLAFAFFGGVPMVPLLLSTDLRRSLPIVTGTAVLVTPLAVFVVGLAAPMLGLFVTTGAMIACNRLLSYRPTSTSNSA